MVYFPGVCLYLYHLQFPCVERIYFTSAVFICAYFQIYTDCNPSSSDTSEVRPSRLFGFSSAVVMGGSSTNMPDCFISLTPVWHNLHTGTSDSSVFSLKDLSSSAKGVINSTAVNTKDIPNGRFDIKNRDFSEWHRCTRGSNVSVPALYLCPFVWVLEKGRTTACWMTHYGPTAGWSRSLFL